MTSSRYVLATALALSLAHAHAVAAEGGREAGDWRIKAGPTLVSPNDDSSALVANGTAVAGTGVAVQDAWALGLIVNYAVTPRFAVELLASTPYEHDIEARGLGGLGINDIGTVSHLPPTLSFQFYPLGNGNSKLQPYLGLGLNYWMPLDEDVDGDVTAALGDSSLDIDASWGLAGQVGVDWAVADAWGLSASLWYVDIETEAELSTPTAGFESIEVDVDVDPWVLFIGVSRRF